MFAMIFLSLGSISANSKTYDEETKTVKIKDTFLFIPLGTVAEVKLNTDLHQKVGLGYQKVAEMDLVVLKNYNQVFKEIKFYNKRKQNFKDYEIHPQFDFKYKSTEQVEVPTYDCTNSYFNDVDDYVNCIVIGSHFEEREIWLNLTKNDLEKGESYTIGIFTTTKEGDYVEWIPEFFDVKIDEWATWSAGLINNVLAYWEHDDAGTTITDQHASYDLTTTNSPTPEQTGVIDYSYLYSETKYASGSVIDPDSYDAGFSTNVWLYVTTSGNGDRYYAFGHAGGWGGYELLTSIGATRNLCMMIGTGDSSGYSCGTGTAFALNTWFMVTTTHTPTSSKIYVDGSLYHSFAGGNADTNTADFYISRYGYNAGSGFEGKADLMGLFGKELTTDEIDELYNDGDACDYNNCIGGVSTITLNSPANDTAQTTNSVLFNATISEVVPINVSLILSGVYNETNSSGVLGDYLFTKTLSEGTHTWNYEACITTECNNGTERTLTIDNTDPIISLIITPPVYIYEDYLLPLNFTVTDDNLDSCYYLYNNESDPVIQATVGDGTFNGWIYFEELMQDITINYTSIAGTAPSIKLNKDKDSKTFTNYQEEIYDPIIPSGINSTQFVVNDIGWHYLEYTYEHDAFGNGWFNTISGLNNETNVNCSANYTTFDYHVGMDTLTFFSNDTLGNLGSMEVEINYDFLEVSLVYDASTIEGKTESFVLTLEKNPSASISQVILHYDGITDSPSLFISSTDLIASSEIIIPSVSADTNVTFYFEIILSDLSSVTTSNYTQFVENIVIDDCSVGTSLFLTLNLKEEETQTSLNGTIETYFEILNTNDYSQVLNFTANYSNVNTKTFCSSLNLNETGFLLNAEVRYNSENYSAEFYNIQKGDLSDYPIELSLYDLLSDDTTKFKLIYKGENLVGVESAIIQLQRKYINEGVYKVVEAPLTSSDSTSIVHVDTNTNLYRATVVKDGVLLNTFENIAFICQSELTGECTVNLFDSITPPNSVPIEELNDLTQTITTSLENQTITYSFSVPSGSNKQINVIAIQKDIIGNKTICNTTLTSSAGSIECGYNQSIQDSYLDYYVYEADNLIAYKSYVVKDDMRDDFDGNNYWILLVFLLSLVFMSISSPEFMIVNAVITFLVGGAIFLVRGMDFVVGIGSLVWLILGAIILILEISKQEDH